jgi:hypothetical protein
MSGTTEKNDATKEKEKEKKKKEKIKKNKKPPWTDTRGVVDAQGAVPAETL